MNAFCHSVNVDKMVNLCVSGENTLILHLVIKLV